MNRISIVLAACLLLIAGCTAGSEAPPQTAATTTTLRASEIALPQTIGALNQYKPPALSNAGAVVYSFSIPDSSTVQGPDRPSPGFALISVVGAPAETVAAGSEDPNVLAAVRQGARNGEIFFRARGRMLEPFGPPRECIYAGVRWLCTHVVNEDKGKLLYYAIMARAQEDLVIAITYISDLPEPARTRQGTAFAEAMSQVVAKGIRRR